MRIYSVAYFPLTYEAFLSEITYRHPHPVTVIRILIASLRLFAESLDSLELEFIISMYATISEVRMPKQVNT